MKLRFLPLLALALATPAYAQRLDGTAVDFGGVLIPVDQARPPAGNDWLAFRPRCIDQMIGEVQPNGEVFWGVPTSDGRMGWLYTLPQMPREQALSDLANMGICKSGTEADGAVAVPIVFSDDVPQAAVAKPEATPVSAVRTVPDTPTGGKNPLLMILAGGVMAAIAGAGMAIINRQRNAPLPVATQHPEFDPFEEI